MYLIHIEQLFALRIHLICICIGFNCNRKTKKHIVEYNNDGCLLNSQLLGKLGPFF